MKATEQSYDILEFNDFLKSHGYNIQSETKNIFRIERKQPVSRLLVLVVFFLGVGLMIVNLVILKDISLTVLAILMVLFPLINRGWKYPFAIVVDKIENFLTVEKGLLFKSYKLYRIDRIDEIAVHRVVKSTEVNPFNDGSKEHIYIYSLFENNKSHQLIRLVSRKNIDDKAKVFSSQMNRLVK